MKQEQVDLFMTSKGQMFPEENQMQIREQLLALPENKWAAVEALNLKNPTVTLICAILGPWDLLYLGQIGMFFLKWLTCNGVWIWWLIGIFKASANTKKVNYEKLAAVL